MILPGTFALHARQYDACHEGGKPSAAVFALVADAEMSNKVWRRFQHVYTLATYLNQAGALDNDLRKLWDPIRS